MPTAPPAKKSNTLMIVLIVVTIVIVVIVAVVGIFASLGIFGVRRYLNESKAAEGRANVGSLARGMVACAENNRAEGKTEALPASAAPVPATLAEVSGKKYLSSPTDWKDPAFDCARFSITTPQYFRYEWVRESNDRGVARAVADLDGDGSPDVTLEVPVSCTATACSAATMVETK